VTTITCTRCKENRTPLPRAPFRNPLGEQILDSICGECWKEWLQHQTVLINHYGLDPREAKSREFLYEQIERVLLKGEEAEGVDTFRQGSVEW